MEYFRGGASGEASGATFTDHVAGARDITRAPVCMYVSYMRQALRPITPRACANGAESAIFYIYFYRERKLWGKKNLLLRSGLEPGSDALQTTAFATEPMGLWQFWTANLALILLTAAVSVDSSEIHTMAIRDIWRKPTDSGITRYTYCTLSAN